MKIKPFFIACLPILLFSGCGTGMKTFNQGAMTGTNISASSQFQFEFAYTDTFTGTNISAATATSTYVILQGQSIANTTILETCNFAGTACNCILLNSSGTKVGTAQTIYDPTGNDLRCTINSAPAFSEVYISNVANTTTSNTLSVIPSASITAEDIMAAAALNENYLSSIYQYQCQQYYMQQIGSTPLNCASAAALTPLYVNMNYYLFGNNYTNNFSSQPSDALYNGGPICGMEVKEFDCTKSQPAAVFSLYSQDAGFFNTPISLTPSPGGAIGLYGYAAPEINWTDTNSYTYTGCPPGLSAEVFWQATDTAAGCASTNIPSLTDTIVNSPATNPDLAGLINHFYTAATSACAVGICNWPSGAYTFSNYGSTCGSTYPYGIGTNTTFCVAPAP